MTLSRSNAEPHCVRRRSFLALSAVLLLGFGSTTFAQSQFWDDAYRLDDDRGSFDWLAKQLVAAPPVAIPGLSADEAASVASEVRLRLIRDRVGTTGCYRAAIAPLETFLEGDHDPQVTALAMIHLGYYRWHVGDLNATRAWDALGFLSDWSLIGPFDNERGSGFDRKGEVESSDDLTAEYIGKRNRVTWRRVSGAGRGGMVELGQLLRPNEEALAYLRTHVRVDAPTKVLLRVGSTGAFAVWLGDEEVQRVDVERRLHFDQDVVALELAPGWNPITIKVGQTKGPWGFRARLTDLAGHVLPLEVRAESPEGSGPAQGRKLATTGSLGALTILERADATPLALLLRGYIIQDRTAHDRNTHPDRELLRQAVTAGDSPVALYLHARTFDREVTHVAEREENRWRRALERVLELDPSFDRARLDLAAYYETRFGNHSRASELIAPLLERQRPPLRALVIAADVAAARLGPVAGTAYRDAYRERLLASAPAVGVRRSEARRLRREGRMDRAEALLRTGLSLDAVDRSLQRDLVDLQVVRGDLDAARATIDRVTTMYPQHTAPHVSIAEFEIARDDLDAAASAVDAAIALCPQNESLHRLRGEILLLAGREAAAADTFRVALDLEPNQPRLREYVDLLSASEARFGDHYRVEVAERIAAAIATEETDNDPYRVLLDNSAVKIHQDGTTSRFRQYVVKVINDQGVQSFDYYPIPYAFGEQWVDVVQARVHRRNGRVEDARIRNRDPEVRQGEYPVWSNAWVDLPPIERGDVVEIEYRTEDLKQSFFGDYFGDRVVFGSGVPTTEQIYTIEAPRDKRLYFHSPRLETPPDVREADGTRSWRWAVRDVAKFDPEPAMPSLAELAPVLEVSTFESWDEFATWYFHLIRKQFESSDEIRAKVQELTAEAKSNYEKIRRIYDFVVTDVRYIAWEFGVHGFKPYNASTIFTRRFGDCKDKATLICTMLDEIGIEAHPVLIYGDRSRAEEDFTLPLVNHFNHCIAYIPDVGNGSGLFVDGTAEHHGVTQLPMMDRGAKVLVVRDDGGSIEEIPWNSPSEQSVAERAEVTILPDGSAAIRQRDDLAGDYAVSIRSSLEIEGQRKQRLERLFGRRFPGVEIGKIETSDLTDLSEPVWLRLELEVPKFAEPSGTDSTSRGLTLPAVEDMFSSLSGLPATATREKREHDLVLGNPSMSELEITIELPPGFEASHLPDSFTATSPDVEFRFTAEATGRTVKLRRQLRRATPRIDAEHYASYRELVERVAQLGVERIKLRRVEDGD